MTLPEMLSTILIMPLQLFFEAVFSFAQKYTDDPGLSIIALSLAVNFLVLPLYNRADAIQAAQRDIENRMKPGVDHIKKVFSGDERMLILQTYYRQNDYKPTDVFKESVSLLLQVPFFIAAYRFLSDLAVLEGASFGFIKDLGQPDGLLSIGPFSVNLLPILMTLINILSALIYTKGFPLKARLQLYAMALVFLVLLYPSPSGLVFYWTLNNLFSLAKNLFAKLKDPLRAFSLLSLLCGIILAVFSLFFFHGSVTRKAFLLVFGILLLLPPVLLKAKGSFFPEKKKKEASKPGGPAFALSCLFLALLMGGLIPSSVIKASPQEFIDPLVYQNPLWYIVYTLCLALGSFLIWMGVFYRIADEEGKLVMEKLLWVYCGISVVDYMFFGTNLGILSSLLQYENGLHFDTGVVLINLAAVALTVFLMLLLFDRLQKYRQWIALTGIISLTIMLILNSARIRQDILPVAQASGEWKFGEDMNIRLSRNGQNVVVLMLDRAMGPYVPYLLHERPELREGFDGFTWYPNAVSFGGYTNFGTPAIYGGYEYTPAKLNKRSDETLGQKQNEALRVLPVLFDEGGFEVTVCDPPYAGYNWIPDISIYNDHPAIRAFNTVGMFGEDNHRRMILNTRRNFFFYSIMKTVPVILQKPIYNGGDYNRQMKKEDSYLVQLEHDPHTATGLSSVFMNSYQVLENLGEITELTENSTGSFLILANNTTHEPMLLQEPEYVPAEKVDNTEYDALHADRFVLDRTMKMETVLHYSHYEANMAMMLCLREWFDHLRDLGVYDNTRIILVSDHGRKMGQFEDLQLGPEGDYDDAQGYLCFLMVKDFNSHGFQTSEEFMTTADVPALALEGLIREPVNPFTKNPITNSEKYAHDQYITTSEEWDTNTNNGNQFLPSDWLAVHDNVWDRANWRMAAKDAVLTEEE